MASVLNLRQQQETCAQRDAREATSDAQQVDRFLERNTAAAKNLADQRKREAAAWLATFIRRRRHLLKLGDLFPHRSDFLNAAELEDDPASASELAARDYINRVTDALQRRAGGE
jgi:hypothetical protein